MVVDAVEVAEGLFELPRPVDRPAGPAEGVDKLLLVGFEPVNGRLRAPGSATGEPQRGAATYGFSFLRFVYLTRPRLSLGGPEPPQSIQRHLHQQVC